MIDEASEEFNRKIQSLRQTGVGGVTLPGGETGGTARTRKGDPTTVKMNVQSGWVVAAPVTKRNKKPQEKPDSSVKIFSLKNMDNPIAPKEPEVKSPETEEQVIGEIVKLQKKLAELKRNQ